MNTQNWLKNTGNFGEWLFRWRGFTPYPIVILFMIFAEPTGTSFLVGLLLIIPGEMLRIWSVAYAGRETREPLITGRQLVTCGPYAWVRNPIYLANLVIYTGVTLIANIWLPIFLFFVWLYFGFQYIFIAGAEEKYLVKTFGDRYERYRKTVPAWLPLREKYRGEALQLDFRKALRAERSTFLSIAAMLAIFLWRMWISQT